MARFLGEGIDQSVADQLKARGAIMSRSPRNESDLKYLNQRTGWVRVTSMVNVGDSSEEAKKLILQGGTVRLNGDSLTMRGGISLNGNTGGAYNTTGDVGTRPMPGITGFNIVSKNRFGTIREANVNFNVWSLEDLKRVEQLYFRVGYSCVIEWGHSVYVNNGGSVENARNTANYKNFFEKGTRDTFQEIITKGKTDTNHNYDGLIGLISNFSWSFRKDGGYDCSIKVISLGEVISSIKASRAMTDFTYLPGDGTTGDKLEDDVATARKSPFHLLVFLLAKADITPEERSKGVITKKEVEDKLSDKLKLTWENIWTELRKPVDAGGLGELPNNLFIGKKYTTSRLLSFFSFGLLGKSTKTYISLRTFLALVNRYYLLKDEKGKTIPRFETADSGNEPKYRTYTGHYSADPWTVLIPTSERKINGIQLDQVTLNKSDDKIYNIFVNIEYIVEKLDPLLNEDDPEINVYEFVKSVIDGLEAPLGDINDFDITYDEDEALYSIIDRNNIITKDKNSIPIVDLTGLKTTVTDLTIESKITDKLVATVAIAAQAEPKGYAEILASQVAWNKGYKDRVLPIKTQTLDEQAQALTDEAQRLAKEQEKINERKAQYEILLEKTYGKLNDPKKNIYKVEDWNGLLPESRFYQTNAINSEKPAAIHPLAGIVPVEVAFTLDGISSLKIGELFKVPDAFLLPGYKQFSYIVTGLEHSIENGRWMSKIKANPIVYPPK